MFRLRDSSLHGSVFALALTSLAVLIALLLRPLLELNFFVPFLAAVFGSAWYYGYLGGLTSTALSAVTLAVLLIGLRPPLYAGGANVAAAVLSYVAMSVAVTGLISQLHRSSSMLTATLSSIADGVLATDREERLTFLNPVAEALTGWRVNDALGRPLGEVMHVIEEGSREPSGSPVSIAIRQGSYAHNAGPVLLIAKDKTEIAIEQSAAPLRDESGRLRGAILVFRDVTNRRQLEEQVSHGRKMDAMGRLAGSVAGDFNNVLTVISGYSDLLRSQAPASSPLRRYADEIMFAGERAAGLTRQLLAFSSGQAAQPKVVDLNAFLAAMEPLLRRMLGESIDLILLPGPSLGRVNIDPAQMHQAILNMITNAREAMPAGGKVVLETTNVEISEPSTKNPGVKPGSYVMLALSDTGSGMDAETRSRLFEPFFTTKQHSKGSGLGLAMVYGTVKQADGHITVYSQVNCGTIFEIYLPRATEAVIAPATQHRVTSKGSETILLVDDDEGLRKLIFEILRNGGYTVIEAASGGAALSAYEKNAHKIDLVLADVVMSQMDGIELGERLTSQNPGLLILYMSGYRDSAAGIRPAPGQPHKAFLNKPFTPETLLARVREVLDARVA